MANSRKNERKRRRRVRRASFLSKLRANFLTGLVVVAPVFLTAYLIWWFVGLIDSWVLPLVPERYQPEPYLGINIKGYGLAIFILFTFLVGSMAKGFIGRAVLHRVERLVDRMPVVRSIYNGLKQIVETALSQSNSSFEQACLVEYPRKGLWAVAFVATETKGRVLESLPGDGEYLSVFLPTTPNPTSGFLLFVPKQDVILLDMDVEAAAKLVISAGLVVPPARGEETPDQPLLPPAEEEG
ncbi:MAG: DUF502 domain-containing protein [Paracoccaceae bacterium]|nr:DUF502 domain-containing protein [Paracoccaceae bacterium]